MGVQHQHLHTQRCCLGTRYSHPREGLLHLCATPGCLKQQPDRAGGSCSCISSFPVCGGCAPTSQGMSRTRCTAWLPHATASYLCANQPNVPGCQVSLGEPTVHVRLPLASPARLPGMNKGTASSAASNCPQRCSLHGGTGEHCWQPPGALANHVCRGWCCFLCPVLFSVAAFGGAVAWPCCQRGCSLCVLRPGRGLPPPPRAALPLHTAADTVGLLTGDVLQRGVKRGIQPSGGVVPKLGGGDGWLRVSVQNNTLPIPWVFLSTGNRQRPWWKEEGAIEVQDALIF